LTTVSFVGSSPAAPVSPALRLHFNVAFIHLRHDLHHGVKVFFLWSHSLGFLVPAIIELFRGPPGFELKPVMNFDSVNA